jgi:hypothetical protein
MRDAGHNAAFFCVADERFFLGLVGLVNSLRVVGHREPIIVLDCGLDTAQRERLAAEATLLDGPTGAPPWLLKTLAPRRTRAKVAVLIDADMIATRSLTPLIEGAADNRVVAFENHRDRWCAQWGELLDLGPLRRRRYVSSGLVALGGEQGAEVLELLHDRQGRVDIELGLYGRKVAGYPLIYPEQDVLNAILMRRTEPERVIRLANRLAPNPPFRGLRLTDAATLRCAYRDGTEPYVVHHFMRKPWLEPTYRSVYSRLLSRLLRGDDVPIAVEPDEVPVWLREGAAGRAARARATAREALRWHFGQVLPDSIGNRIEAARRRREAGPS